MNGKTTAKTPHFTMPKTMRKKLHWGMKANRCRCICRRVLTTKMNTTMETVPRKKTAKATVTEMAEVKQIPALEEDMKND